jgi:hypothetical protein
MTINQLSDGGLEEVEVEGSTAAQWLVLGGADRARRLGGLATPW